MLSCTPNRQVCGWRAYSILIIIRTYKIIPRTQHLAAYEGILDHYLRTQTLGDRVRRLPEGLCYLPSISLNDSRNKRLMINFVSYECELCNYVLRAIALVLKTLSVFASPLVSKAILNLVRENPFLFNQFTYFLANIYPIIWANQ